ncbi:aminotransferase DegT [Helicobacter jaachi]|uniref:Aminotransferase DegT n=1 Tax=Helicobacter jaachi TaxID=1677920 RepID=A0A4V6I2K2_9HELI|nr:LegC family aminotransferase [Helicobacter jaachi]TLD96502.1 aminotransferase DegT [Helicobacter jaachi]
MAASNLENLDSIFAFIRELYDKKQGHIALHEPLFVGNEKAYLNACIESGFVSSVGEFVNTFERQIAAFCGSKYAIATTNGTCALHATLHALGVDTACEVITQPLSFIATSNAIAYTGASPIYIDVDVDSLSLSPKALRAFLESSTIMKAGKAHNKHSGKVIKACVPMHTFGHPARIYEIKQICDEWGIWLIEDAAESLGSYYNCSLGLGVRHSKAEYDAQKDSSIFEEFSGLYKPCAEIRLERLSHKQGAALPENYQKDEFLTHTGTIGICGILSFNGNKTITCGGGGIILTNDESLAKRLKHLTTTAKIPHAYEYRHDELGFNYRLPNINAALACAQLELLPKMLDSKRAIAQSYADFFESFSDITFINARSGTLPNFWLNAIRLDSKKARDTFLERSNAQGIMTRPIWQLNNLAPMYAHAQCGDLRNAIALSDTIVNIPSSARMRDVINSNDGARMRDVSNQ